MYQFYIVEIQKYSDGTYGHLVHWAFDEDPETAKRKAESKYYLVLSAAAVSNLPCHSAIMFSSDGLPLLHHSYENPVQPAPEPEPEPEETPEEEPVEEPESE